ncbi:hypothetical protein DL769_007774 [Monosporascus sp. CRB-8-3]|nr:hypothetical protein DL769_007774 [Monosporascus sp. CRB-8-3]
MDFNEAFTRPSEALHACIRDGDLPCLRQLTASDATNINAAHILLGAGADPLCKGSNDVYITYMELAAIHGRRDMSRLFRDTLELQPPLDRDGVEFDKRRRFLVRCPSKAAAYGHGNIVGDYLDWTLYRSSPRAREVALFRAAERWQASVVDVLLGKVIYDTVTLEKALTMVVGVKAMLIEKERSGVQYEWADYDRRYHAVVRLRSAGCEANRLDQGRPLLYLAISGIVLQGALKALRERGAAMNCSTGIVHLYLSHCADENAALSSQNHHGETLLHYAAAGGQSATIELPPGRGLDVNAKSDNGWTPPICALAPTEPGDLPGQFRTRSTKSEAEAVNAARLLLSYGANPTIITAEGWTLFHCVGSYPQKQDETDTSATAAVLARELVSRDDMPPINSRARGFHRPRLRRISDAARLDLYGSEP